MNGGGGRPTPTLDGVGGRPTPTLDGGGGRPTPTLDGEGIRYSNKSPPPTHTHRPTTFTYNHL